MDSQNCLGAGACEDLIVIAPERAFDPGLNVTYPEEAVGVDSVMSRFAAEGVPVINLSGIQRLGRDYGIYPDGAPAGVVGVGPAYRRPMFRPGVVWACLAGLLLLLLALRGWEARIGREEAAAAAEEVAPVRGRRV